MYCIGVSKKQSLTTQRFEALTYKVMTHHTNLPQDLQGTVDAAVAAQEQNPDAESFIVTYVIGFGWRLISAKTGKRYTQKSYFREFGRYPDLPHPEVYYSPEAMAERERRKRPKPKGFGQ